MPGKRRRIAAGSGTHGSNAEVNRYPTPLRYPGGKRRLGPFFAQLITNNGLFGCHYVEPFAGGAGAALYLLQRKLVNSIHLNDFDRSIYAFWFAVTRRNAALRRLIETTPITTAEWDRQKQVQREKNTAPLLDLGFSTLFLNRTNRSGILRAGMIGGRNQKGDWRLDARFNRAAIVERVAALHPFVSRLSISCMDAVECLLDLCTARDVRPFVYLDPPYVVKGPDLYLNKYTLMEHSSLATFVTRKLRCDWVVTYDDVPFVRKLYGAFEGRGFQLGYSADKRSVGREVMFASRRLTLPSVSK